MKPTCIKYTNTYVYNFQHVVHHTIKNKNYIMMKTVSFKTGLLPLDVQPFIYIVKNGR